jgi:hypothetical protein
MMMAKPPLTKFTLKKNDRVRTPYGIGRVAKLSDNLVTVQFDDNSYMLLAWGKLSWP